MQNIQSNERISLNEHNKLEYNNNREKTSLNNSLNSTSSSYDIQHNSDSNGEKLTHASKTIQQKMIEASIMFISSDTESSSSDETDKEDEISKNQFNQRTTSNEIRNYTENEKELHSNYKEANLSNSNRSPSSSYEIQHNQENHQDSNGKELTHASKTIQQKMIEASIMFISSDTESSSSDETDKDDEISKNQFDQKTTSKEIQNYTENEQELHSNDEEANLSDSNRSPSSSYETHNNQENHQEPNDEEEIPSPLDLLMEQTMQFFFPTTTDIESEPAEPPYLENDMSSIQSDEKDSSNDAESHWNVRNIKDKTGPWSDYLITSNDVEDELTCAICYIRFNESEKAVKLNCKHVFHNDCILKWYDKNRSYLTCPLCRNKM